MTFNVLLLRETRQVFNSFIFGIILILLLLTKKREKLTFKK